MKGLPLRVGAPLVAAVFVTACGASPSPASPPSSSGIARGSGLVKVMYAGSLTGVFEKKVGPAFRQASGFSFQGEGKGSVAIANLIKGKILTPDVFVSADPTVNQNLQGPGNGNFVAWWVSFARTEMVVAWSPKSRFVSEFEAARAGRRTWESVLEAPGMRLGRTDPELDPKGYRTLWLFQLDEQRTGEVGEAQRILGAPTNPTQIFPEEQLAARLQAGQLDAGIFYTIEAIEAHLPYLSLPPAVNQGDPAQAARYASLRYTNRKGHNFAGSPIIYTVTIPTTVTNPRGAESFVRYLLSKEGQALLAQEGLLSTAPAVEGERQALPPSIRAYVKA